VGDAPGAGEQEPLAARWLLPRATVLWRWGETVGITLVAIVIGLLVSPRDPFFVVADFPWIWLAPALIALRYGMLPGVVSSAILAVGWLLWVPGGLDAELPILDFLGGLILTMVCGEYSSTWTARLRRQSEVNVYLEDRVERVTKRLYLARLSHERLEQDLLARPTTLRDALADMRRRVSVHTGQGRLSGAQEFLSFLAQHCQLEVAAIYSIEGASLRTLRRVAGIGEPPLLKPDDALLVHAWERSTLAHVQSAELDQSAPTDHLVIVPITASDGNTLGFVAVTRMPFFALNEEVLQLLTVLASVYADGVTAASRIMPLIEANPGCPIEFAEELLKLQRIQRDFGISSHIVVLAFGDSLERADAFHLVNRQRRSPDVVWNREDLAGCGMIVNLMPLAGRAAVDGYLRRIELSIRESFGTTMSALKVQPHVIPLSVSDPLAVLHRLSTKYAEQA